MAPESTVFIDAQTSSGLAQRLLERSDRKPTRRLDEVGEDERDNEALPTMSRVITGSKRRWRRMKSKIWQQLQPTARLVHPVKS
jgi:hypothetical protein